MKKLFFITLATFIVANVVYAQMPQGGGFGSRGGQGGGRGGEGHRGGHPSEGRDFNRRAADETPILEFFPEIPNLTLEQRTEIGNVLSDEQKYIRKLESQKHELMKKEREATAQDERKIEKNQKKMAKIDGKIQKRIEKSDKKIKKKLLNEQYLIFLEKRGEFRFSTQRPARIPDGRELGGKENMPRPQQHYTLMTGG
jgi:Spy/CpxP family protein refolding chaperone